MYPDNRVRESSFGCYHMLFVLITCLFVC